MTTTDRLAGVDPELAAKIRRILNAMQALGFPMMVTDGFRTVQQQKRLFAQGRTPSVPGPIVTRADGVVVRSNHQDGRAVDCTFLDANGKPRWIDADPWELYGCAAEALGLKWGGRWRRPDRPHLELPEGL